MYLINIRIFRKMYGNLFETYIMSILYSDDINSNNGPNNCNTCQLKSVQNWRPEFKVAALIVVW